MITRDRTAEINAALVSACLVEFDTGKDRRLELYKYFAGEHDILLRERTTGLPNNQLVHNYPKYIATMTSGYLIGSPVSYSDDKQEQALDTLLDAYKAANTESMDSEIALHAAIFGRGVELCYANSDAMPRTAALDPMNAFVVYDNTVEHKALFGVYRLVKYVNGKEITDSITTYTDSEIITYTSGTASLTEKDRVPHNFGSVPMVEYWNNSVETGDFEDVISLIDAYNTLESDRVNDREQFADALLVLHGVRGLDAPSDSEDTRTPGQRLREDRTLALPDEKAGANYLTKQLSEADIEVLKNALKADIHKFSLVPDLTDEKFAGNSSGVAMKYKLLGLEQLTKIKERWFREGLRSRLRLFAFFLGVKGKGAIDPESVTITFKRSLPVNELEISQMVANLSGMVPDELLLAQVPFIQDVSTALDTLKKQKEEDVARQQKAFGGYPDANKNDPGAVTDAK